MAESKIDFSFENFHFACEGDQNWVEAQLNQVLNRIPWPKKPEFPVISGSGSLSGTKNSLKESVRTKVPGAHKIERSKRGPKPRSVAEPEVVKVSADPLLEFLIEKDADKNQVKKFLAAAVFLHSRGQEKFSTTMISKFLKSAHTEKLINASDCLNKNEKKGFCIKEDKEFILTDAGIRSIIGGTEE
jgi:hypothetical protein